MVTSRLDQQRAVIGYAWMGAYFVDGDAGGMRFGTVGPVRARWLTRDALESISPAQRPGGR